MSKKTELVEGILKLRNKENDIRESKFLYGLTNKKLEKIYNYESLNYDIENKMDEILKKAEKIGLYDKFLLNDIRKTLTDFKKELEEIRKK